MSKKDKLLVHEIFCYVISALVSAVNIIAYELINPTVVLGLALFFIFAGLGFHIWWLKTNPDPPDRWDSHLKSVEDLWSKTDK